MITKFEEFKKNTDYSKILDIVKENFPQYTWNYDEPCSVYSNEELEDDDDNETWFCTDLESIEEMEMNNDENIVVVDDGVEIVYEITFESDEEVFCQVYTDEDGNIRSMYLNID